MRIRPILAWDIAEYVTFLRFSSELATADTDTLGDVTLGTLGGFAGATLVELAPPRSTGTIPTG